MRTSDRAATTPVAPQSIQSKPRIAQSVVKTPLSVRFPGLEEFGTIEFDAGPPQKPGETLKKTICGLVVQCLKKSRYRLVLSAWRKADRKSQLHHHGNGHGRRLR
jgi:hypothetical protein